jgi:hypothetical protein
MNQSHNCIVFLSSAIPSASPYVCIYNTELDLNVFGIVFSVKVKFDSCHGQDFSHCPHIWIGCRVWLASYTLGAVCSFARGKVARTLS